MATPAVLIPDPTTDEPPQRRRWIPLSLRLFVAILLLLGIVSTLTICTIWIPYYRQQELIREIKGWGMGQFATWPDAPFWLRTLLGDDRIEKFEVFRRLKGVILEGPRFDDAKLAYLSRWTNIENFSLIGTSVTDAGLAHLRGLRNVKSLNIAGAPGVTDEGLAHLASCENLTVLNVANCTRVTDAGLVHLKGLNNLEWLLVSGTGITDDGLEDFRKALPNCKIHLRGPLPMPRTSK